MKPITPVKNNTIRVIIDTNAVGTAIFTPKGHFNISIFLILPFLLTTSSSVVNSSISVGISGVLSSIRTFIALSIAFSTFLDIVLQYLLGGSSISFFPFSKYALRSIASGGVFPVIILYNTAPTA